jgi:hypothetical protein
MAQTITNLKTLKINQLTEEQYQEALAQGLIKEDEIYITPALDTYSKSDIDTKLTSYIDDVAALVGGDA